MKKLTWYHWLILLLSSYPMWVNAKTDIKTSIEKQGFEFIQKIPAPQGMTGWAGHHNQHPATVFISNDQQYYIVGDLYNAQGENLSIDAMNTHVKNAVLEDVWNTLATSTWIQDGDTKAPRIIYVFSDPNCPYCHTFWQQARPWVKSGQVQLRHIMVGVIRDESRAQVATLLMSDNPRVLFSQFNTDKTKTPLLAASHIPAEITKKLDFNEGLMDKYGFFSTPSMIWKDRQGRFKSAQGTTTDLKEIFEK